jgi:hypothetical protein
MLTEIYIDALLVDGELADQVWEAWDAGKTDDQTVCMAWMLIAGLSFPINCTAYVFPRIDPRLRLADKRHS